MVYEPKLERKYSTKPQSRQATSTHSYVDIAVLSAHVPRVNHFPNDTTNTTLWSTKFTKYTKRNATESLSWHCEIHLSLQSRRKLFRFIINLFYILSYSTLKWKIYTSWGVRWRVVNIGIIRIMVHYFFRTMSGTAFIEWEKSCSIWIYCVNFCNLPFLEKVEAYQKNRTPNAVALWVC